jgi:hypothetical protein
MVAFFMSGLIIINKELSTFELILIYLVFIYASYLITSGFCGLLELVTI